MIGLEQCVGLQSQYSLSLLQLLVFVLNLFHLKHIYETHAFVVMLIILLEQELKKDAIYFLNWRTCLKNSAIVYFL